MFGASRRYFEVGPHGKDLFGRRAAQSVLTAHEQDPFHLHAASAHRLGAATIGEPLGRPGIELHRCRRGGTAAPHRATARRRAGRLQGCSNRESRESQGANLKKPRFAPNSEAFNKIPNFSI